LSAVSKNETKSVLAQEMVSENTREASSVRDFRIVGNLLITQTLPFESALKTSEKYLSKINTFLHHNLGASFHSRFCA
jgi:hypothetical protein